MSSLRIATLALAALLGSVLVIDRASAMPANGLALAANQIADSVQDVRWVCGPYRCWLRPGPYLGGPYWGPRPYGWGWHRRWWGPGPYWRGPYWGPRPYGWGWHRRWW
jgi:hypothetical protein